MSTGPGSKARWRRWSAVPLVVTVFSYLAQLTFTSMAGRDPADVIGFIAFAAMVLLFPLTGLLILRRQPDNRIGWLLAAIGLAWSVGSLLSAYEAAGAAAPDWPPGADIVAAVNSGLWVPPILLMGFLLILIYPDGRLPSPRWRIPVQVMLAVAILLPIGFAIHPGPVEDAIHPLPANPIGLEAAGPIVLVFIVIMLPLVPISVLAAAASLVLRYRHASGLRRLQLKWLMSAGAAIAAIYGTTTLLSLALLSRATPGWLSVMQSAAGITFCLIPISIGIAITRHGLYGIDTLISRALTVTILGAFVTAVYVGIVAGISVAIGDRHPSIWLSVLATGLVAVAFQPVRERVHRGVNRLVYGVRATPYEVLSDFAVRMTGRYTTGELLPQLARMVAESLGGGQVDVWLQVGGRLVREAAWPDDGERTVHSDLGRELDPAGLHADLVVPVRHQDELLGALAVTKHAHEPVAPNEQALLAQVASQAGLVLRNLRLVEDLQRSRERLMTSQDDERRRLERDLHDGAQQSLVSVAIQLKVAAEHSDRQAALDAVAAASRQLATAIAELRELAHGIHPAILTERGLGPAVQSLASRSPIPVQLHTSLDRRLPETVEGTVYFVVAEGLANVAKYAHASLVEVTLNDEGEAVAVIVRDDGVGGADIANGSGLLGLIDRLAVVDGVLTLESPVGGGTRLSCRIPLSTSRETLTAPTGQESAALARA